MFVADKENSIVLGEISAVTFVGEYYTYKVTVWERKGSMSV